VAAPQVLDEGVPDHDNPGVAVSLEAAHGSESGLEPPVVGLDSIVGVPLNVVERPGQELIEDRRVAGGSIGGDLDRSGGADHRPSRHSGGDRWLVDETYVARCRANGATCIGRSTSSARSST
jgi:hypothetical protein